MPGTGSRRFTIRARLFGALALLATLGASGGVLSLLNLKALAQVYRSEQEVVEAHEAIHDNRIQLLGFMGGVLQEPAPGPEELARRQALLAEVMVSTQHCDACHAALTAHLDLARQLELVRDLARQSADPGAIHQTASAVERSLGTMEKQFHDLLELRRTSGKEVLWPSLTQQAGLVLGGLAAALFLAWFMARALSRPILPLIAAARRWSADHPALPSAVERDPDLAEVAHALQDLAQDVAERARAGVRGQLLERLMVTQEEERKRVARELHDELGQSLSALLLELRAPRNPAEDGPGHAVVEARVRGLMDEVRRMAWNLRPTLLDDYGLHSALQRYVEELARRAMLAMDYQSVGLAEGHPRLPALVETALFRVAQEALTNVVRHAQAQRVSVVLVRRDAQVLLLVEDDGAGFDVEVRQFQRQSLGLLGMEERVGLLGGTLSIVSAPGQGTAVRAVIPLEEQPS